MVAKRYFAAHPQPEPKVWSSAKEGEYWLVDIDEYSDPEFCTVVSEKDHFLFQSRDALWALSSPSIRGAVQLVPKENL